MKIMEKSQQKISTSQCSFLRGYRQLSDRQKLAFEVKVMEMLNYTSTSTFRKRLIGEWPVIHRDVAMKAVEKLFHWYGIRDVWGL